MINLIVENRDQNNRLLPNGTNSTENDLDYPRLSYYLYQCNIPVRLVNLESAPPGSWYLMVLGFFNHDCDYFQLMTKQAYQRLLKKEIMVVFTYHEGDNPRSLRDRLDYWCEQHGIDKELVWLVSGNSSANRVPNCVYWPELEFMYWRSTDLNSGGICHLMPRSQKFMALCRIDKLWRRAFMSELWAKGLHQHGYFSYNQVELGHDSNYHGNPLYLEYLYEKTDQMNAFIAAGPFHADNLNSDQHNDYSVNLEDMYEDSYFNVVLETVLDTDNSGGAFVTEKTFKPIFNNQFFIEVAAANTLAHLRDLGYQTFGSCIDEHYDTVSGHQERFDAALDATVKLAQMSLQELHDIYTELCPVIRHNHYVFRQGMAHRLQSAMSRISYKL